MPQAYEISESDVSVNQSAKLGMGGFAAVYRGEWSGGGVAIVRALLPPGDGIVMRF